MAVRARSSLEGGERHTGAFHRRRYAGRVAVGGLHGFELGVGYDVLEAGAVEGRGNSRTGVFHSFLQSDVGCVISKPEIK